MATTFDNIEQLNADIRENIGPNGAGRITGAILQNVLLSMTLTIDALKAEAAALSQESQERRDADATIRGLIETKQNIIADLEQIRAGALAGAAAYVKPAAGIPATDLAQAVQHALELANTALQGSELEAITALIPEAASPSNQLADKAFVNSSISTNTAYYISNNGQPFNSVEELVAYSGPLTNNDYAFVVGRDSEGNTTYTRYKYNASTQQWGAEFVLNNSSFTAVQWAAINSGITAALVASIPLKYVKPDGGIPATDLAQAVRELLAAAGTALQPSAIANMEVITNKVTTIQNGATDIQYPSALAVLTALNRKADKMPVNPYNVIPVVFEPSVNTYNRFDVAVDTLAVNLPAISDTSKVQSLVLSLTTGTNPNITFVTSDGSSVRYFDGYNLEAGKTYEINCLFNGVNWVVAYGIVA